MFGPVVVKVFRQQRCVNGTLLQFIDREVRQVRTAMWKEEGKEEEEEVVGGRGGAKKGNVSHLRWQLAQRDLPKPP